MENESATPENVGSPPPEGVEVRHYVGPPPPEAVKPPPPPPPPPPPEKTK